MYGDMQKHVEVFQKQEIMVLICIFLDSFNNRFSTKSQPNILCKFARCALQLH